MIGFLIFISIGTFFRYQSDLFRERIISSNVNITNSYLSSLFITLVDSCKECDFVNVTIKTQNTSTGYPIDVKMKDSKLETSVEMLSGLIATTVHNLLIDTVVSSGASSSAKTIILTFNRTNYTLRVD